eukprot:Tamp_04648.p1 GENE.Tamp_04648~~Tamp_04648.p1  ORF type:complete len:558 (+),score=66.67 Tamp_04648:730-2403(+)
MQANIDGGEPDLQHLVHPATNKDLPGPRILPVPGGGYSEVVSKVASTLPAHSIIFNSPVTSISCTPLQHGGVACVRYDNGDEEHSISAPVVILTVSLGVLQAPSLLFHPPLPMWKIEAIKRMRIGHVEKIFFEFSDQDWEQLDSLLLSYISLFPSHEARDSLGLLQNITGLYRVPNTRYMCCWVTGEIACRQIQQAGDDALIDCLCREILPAYVTPAHGAQGVPRAKAVVRSTWSSSPTFRGSYSYIHRHSSPDDIALLGRPVAFHPRGTTRGTAPNEEEHRTATPTVLFAGEATHPSYYGTVHGAFMTGEREAERAIEILRRSSVQGDLTVEVGDGGRTPLLDAEGRPARVLCFGDSLTAGYWANGAKFHPYARLASQLLGGVVVDHVGLSGWTSEEMVEALDGDECVDVCDRVWKGLRVQLASAPQPYSHCVILAGTNDVGMEAGSSEDIFRNLCALAAEAETQGCKAFLLTIPELSCEADVRQVGRLRTQVNRLLLAEESLRTIDVAALLPYHHAAIADRDRIFEPDGLHLRPAGYDVIASAVAARLAAEQGER